MARATWKTTWTTTERATEGMTEGNFAEAEYGAVNAGVRVVQAIVKLYPLVKLRARTPERSLPTPMPHYFRRSRGETQVTPSARGLTNLTTIGPQSTEAKSIDGATLRATAAAVFGVRVDS